MRTSSPSQHVRQVLAWLCIATALLIAVAEVSAQESRVRDSCSPTWCRRSA
ncbi:MAG: hypothetical protein NTW72_04030 [Gemmatimonadetes bacterium]|nr:hypothetical protein [Gemmatimonadota bacterium]